MATSLVNWREWSDQAFSDAREQDKPVLMGISAVWCHWCHVMDRGVPGDPVHTGVYSAPDIAEYINQNFIPVRVDNDQRPDINARYNMGGWPTTCFLTPDGDVIYGGTYIAPGQMRSLLQQVLQYWHNRRDELNAQIAEREPVAGESAPADGASALPEAAAVISEVCNHLIKNYDRRNGGLGGGQKFPMTDAWDLLLAAHHGAKDARLLDMVSTTLVAMGTKGMYDLVAGGWFRYSTTPDWSVPHFEKMLEDHGKLLKVYLHAVQAFSGSGDGDPGWQQVREKLAGIVRASLGYLTTELLYDRRGITYFAGSQDADEEYYLLSKAERAGKTAPYIDWRLYADWNASMVSALFLAADVLGDPSYAHLAEKVFNTVIRLCVNPDGGVIHSVTVTPDEKVIPAALVGQLGDQAALAQACLDQHVRAVTARRMYGRSRLELAQWIVGYASRELAAEAGGFYDSPARPGALGMLKVRIRPIFENVALADALGVLARLDEANAPAYRAAIDSTLAAFAAEYPRYREHGGPYALALLRATREPEEIMIVCDAAQAEPFVLAAHARYSPWRIVRVLDPKEDAALIAARGYPTAQLPVAFVCRGTTCSAPIFEASGLLMD